MARKSIASTLKKAIGILLLLIPLAGMAQTTDAFGWLLSTACANSTGYFTVAKQGNRWWFCTPSQHLYFFQSVGAMAGDDSLWTRDGGRNQYANAMVAFIKSVGFNGVGQKSSDFTGNSTRRGPPRAAQLV